MTLRSPTEVAEHVEIVASSSAPAVVGISGYGGSGKSTLARALVDLLPGAVRIRGDDFLDPTRSHRPSDDWDGVDRERLVAEVLAPFRAGQASRFRRWDWAAGALAEPEPVPEARILIVDAVGLFHPLAMPHLDVTVWVGVDLVTATQRGKARDHAMGRDHDRLWDEVWVPNEIAFDRLFRPRELADAIYG